MSDKGTLIRLWDTSSAKKLHELRRGTYQAVINELSFELLSSKYLCVSSDHDTLHIFKVSGDAKNTGSWFSALGMVGVPVVASEWSHCQVRLPKRNRPGSFSTCMSKDDTVFIASEEGWLCTAAVKQGEQHPTKQVYFNAPE